MDFILPIVLSCVYEKDKNREVDRMNGHHRQLKRTAAFAAVLLLFLFLCWGLWATGFLEVIHSPEEMQEYIQRFAPYSHAVFFLLQLISVIVAPIPSNLTTVAGGLLFGAGVSFLITAFAVILGSAIVFLLSRSIGQPFTQRFISGRSWERYGEVIRKKRDVFLFLAFLFPFFPDDLLCIMAGLTDISFRRFLILVILGRPWGLLAAAAVGGSVVSIPWWGMALIGVGGLLFFLVVLRYGDRLEEQIIGHLSEPKPRKT